jgi:hypothetical protein
MFMKRNLVVIALLFAVGVGCSADGSVDSPARGKPARRNSLVAGAEPASLTVSIPSFKIVMPKCRAPSVRLRRAGTDLGCGAACMDGEATCTIRCSVARELRSATPYVLSVAYVQAGADVAKANLGTVTLSAGANQLQAPVESVTVIDTNNDGVPDIEKLCP